MASSSPTTTVTSAWETRTPTGRRARPRSWCPAPTVDAPVSRRSPQHGGSPLRLQVFLLMSALMQTTSDGFLFLTFKLVDFKKGHMSVFDSTARKLLLILIILVLSRVVVWKSGKSFVNFPSESKMRGLIPLLFPYSKYVLHWYLNYRFRKLEKRTGILKWPTCCWTGTPVNPRVGWAGSEIRTYWGAPVARLGECGSHVHRLSPQQWPWVQFQHAVLSRRTETAPKQIFQKNDDD